MTAGPTDDSGEGQAGEAESLQLATLEAINALAKRQRAEPPRVHTDQATGMSFRYRPLTGAERAQARAQAVKTGTFNMIEFERQVGKAGMVEPKYDDVLWIALGTVQGGLREGLLNAIQQASGMAGDDPLAQPAGDSMPTAGNDASGIA